MTEKQIFELKINDKVEVSFDAAGLMGRTVKVAAIDDWRKVVGVTNNYGLYFELPYRKIIRKIIRKINF